MEGGDEQHSDRGLGAQHEQRRTQIADAVLAIVAERGLPAVSPAEVAARLHHDYERLHEQIADRHDQITDAADTAVALVALAEGLAYYVLIDVYPAEAARDRLLTAIAEVY